MNRHHQRPLRARLGLVLAGAVVMATALAGCSAAATELDADTAQALQSGVKSVTVAAAAGDFATAQTELSAVRGTLAGSADRLTASRTTTIQTAIDLVDADLAAAIAASAPDEPQEPEETAKPQESTKPVEPEKSEDTVDTVDNPATDQPEEDQQDEDEAEKDKAKKDKAEKDKAEKDKDNPGQCKKNDTCE